MTANKRLDHLVPYLLQGRQQAVRTHSGELPLTLDCAHEHYLDRQRGEDGLRVHDGRLACSSHHQPHITCRTLNLLLSFKMQSQIGVTRCSRTLPLALKLY